jgi:hypothetical protein
MYKGGKDINSEEISESEIDAAAMEMFYNNSDSGWMFSSQETALKKV